MCRIDEGDPRLMRVTQGLQDILFVGNVNGILERRWSGEKVM